MLASMIHQKTLEIANNKKKNAVKSIDLIPDIMYNLNTQVSQATSKTPFEIAFNSKPKVGSTKVFKLLKARVENNVPENAADS